MMIINVDLKTARFESPESQLNCALKNNTLEYSVHTKIDVLDVRAETRRDEMVVEIKGEISRASYVLANDLINVSKDYGQTTRIRIQEERGGGEARAEFDAFEPQGDEEIAERIGSRESAHMSNLNGDLI